MPSRKLALATLVGLLVALESFALSAWAAAGPCMAEPFGC